MTFDELTFLPLTIYTYVLFQGSLGFTEKPGGGSGFPAHTEPPSVPLTGGREPAPTRRNHSQEVIGLLGLTWALYMPCFGRTREDTCHTECFHCP